MTLSVCLSTPKQLGRIQALSSAGRAAVPCWTWWAVSRLPGISPTSSPPASTSSAALSGQRRRGCGIFRRCTSVLAYRIVFVAEARHAADGGQGGVQGKDHQECLAHAQSCLHLARPAMFPVQSAAVYLAACVNPQMQPLASVIILSDGVYRHVLFIKCFFLLQTDCTCCMCLRVK